MKVLDISMWMHIESIHMCSKNHSVSSFKRRSFPVSGWCPSLELDWEAELSMNSQGTKTWFRNTSPFCVQAHLEVNHSFFNSVRKSRVETGSSKSTMSLPFVKTAPLAMCINLVQQFLCQSAPSSDSPHTLVTFFVILACDFSAGCVA
jgi:hypothetical protein